MANGKGGTIDVRSWNQALEEAAINFEARGDGWPSARKTSEGPVASLEAAMFQALRGECKALAGQLRQMKKKHSPPTMGISGIDHRSDSLMATLFITDATGYSGLGSSDGVTDGIVLSMPSDDIGKNIKFLRQCADELLILQSRLPRGPQ